VSSSRCSAALRRYPELMIRLLIVGYCYGIRFERKLCEEVKLHLGYRWVRSLEQRACSTRSVSGAEGTRMNA